MTYFVGYKTSTEERLRRDGPGRKMADFGARRKYTAERLHRIRLLDTCIDALAGISAVGRLTTTRVYSYM